jgi:NAD(P)-dependent dehydrogenase (short-subunit alcohol dehydrogenase family)
VIVAGGTGALGSAVSAAFIREGATVVATFRSPEEYQRLVSQGIVDASRLEGEPIDVTDEQAVHGLVDAVLARHGRIDVLVDTVGGYTGGVKLWDLEAQALDRMLDRNLRSFYCLSRGIVPVLLKQRRGAIVNIVAKAAIEHPAGASVYAAAKAAALALSDSLAAELLGTGVRANCLLPSVIDTPANRGAMPHANFDRWPKPNEIADVVLFLCSEAAKAIHGAAIPVYGGG